MIKFKFYRLNPFTCNLHNFISHHIAYLHKFSNINLHNATLCFLIIQNYRRVAFTYSLIFLIVTKNRNGKIPTNTYL